MKTIALAIVLGSITSFNLAAQIQKKPGHSDYLKKDSALITFPSDDQKNSNIKKKPGIPDSMIVSPVPDLDRRHSGIEPMLRSHSDKYRAETFPGADIFYAKRPYILRPSDKLFIIKPDTISKYYLIIKDPFTGRITK